MIDRLLLRRVYIGPRGLSAMKESVCVHELVDAVADLPDDEILGVATLILQRVKDPCALINWVAQSLTGG